MLIKSLILIFSFFASSCVTSNWVSKEYHPYKAGVIKYLDAGADGIINSRRKDAMSKIALYCGREGSTILKESHDSSWDVYQINPNSYNDGYTGSRASSQYLHIYFRCGKLDK